MQAGANLPPAREGYFLLRHDTASPGTSYGKMKAQILLPTGKMGALRRAGDSMDVDAGAPAALLDAAQKGLARDITK